MSRIADGFQVGLSWVPIQNNVIPRGALEVQRGIFVARARLGRELLPGKYSTRFRTCYVPHGGLEHQVSNCEILTDSSIFADGSCYRWQPGFGGEVPRNAIVAGIADNRQPIYICRAPLGGEMCVGKIHYGLGAYIPYDGKEWKIDTYEVLCLIV